MMSTGVAHSSSPSLSTPYPTIFPSMQLLVEVKVLVLMVIRSAGA